MHHIFARILPCLVVSSVLVGANAMGGDCCCGSGDEQNSQHVYVLTNHTDAELRLELVSGWEETKTVELPSGESITLKSAPRNSGKYTEVKLNVSRGEEALGSAVSTMMDMYYGRGGVTVQGEFHSSEYRFRQETFAVTNLRLRYPPGHLLRTVNTTQEIQRKLIEERPAN